MLFIKAKYQKRILPNLHHTYNERHEKIIELIDWIVEKYKKAAVADTKKRTNRIKKNKNKK